MILVDIDFDRITVPQPTTESSLEAAWCIRRTIRAKGSSIKKIVVQNRKAELTFDQRYNLYVAKVQQLQHEVNKRAADNPEELLYNMYTNVSCIPHSLCTHAFFDQQKVERYV